MIGHARRDAAKLKLREPMGMQEREVAIKTFEELHAYVHQELCASENLLAEQFQTHAKGLYVKEKLCGIEFSLLGLRSVRLGAIWAADQNVIYFYNARGERSLKVKLTNRIAQEAALAG